MRRRACLALIAGAAASSIAGADTSDAWAAWKAAFLRPDGRVVDALQDDASHSEGQGYGMLLAAFEQDADAFAAMHAWTERHLAVRRDPLLAWRWLPRSDPNVPDYNNASDGDLFYAWALLEAAVCFDVPAYRDRAAQIARFLATACIRPDPRDGAARLLLPAAERFEDEERRIVNPSYIMPRAMSTLAATFDLPDLARAVTDGLDLIAQLAQHGPVPDWVEIDSDGIRPARGFAAQSGYEAMRVPLYLSWSGGVAHPALIRAAADHAAASGAETPTVFALDGTVLRRSGYPGYAALSALARCVVGNSPVLPRFDADQPYYPATLHMLALHAAHVEAWRCLPTTN